MGGAMGGGGFTVYGDLLACGGDTALARVANHTCGFMRGAVGCD